MNVATVWPQVQNRVPDELPRAVIGDVAAATGFKDLNAFSREFVLGGENVRPIVSCFDAEGDDRWMLQ
jgi:hypothetical protein